MSSQWLKKHPMVTWMRVIAVSIVTAGIMPLCSHAQTYRLSNVELQLLGDEVLKGRLIRMTSDSLFMEMKRGKIRTVHYRSVDYVKMHRWRGAENGFLLGAGAGLAVGFLAGVAANDGGSTSSMFSGLSQNSQLFRIGWSGLLGALAGGCIGAVIGSLPKQVPIQGDRKKYEDLRTKCMMTFWKQTEKEKRRP